MSVRVKYTNRSNRQLIQYVLQLSTNAFYFKFLVLFTVVAVLAISVSSLSTVNKNGHVIGNADILKLMPYKTRETPRHFLAKRSPLKKFFKIPLVKKGLLLTKTGLSKGLTSWNPLVAKKGLLIG